MFVTVNLSRALLRATRSDSMARMSSMNPSSPSSDHRRSGLNSLLSRLLPGLFVLFLAVPPVSAEAELGVHAGSDTEVERAIEPMRALGVKWVRLWADVDWAAPRDIAAFDQARAFHAAGFRVVVCLSGHHDPAVPNPAEVRAYCEWLLDAAGLREAVDVWEIGNEINVPRYWHGTPAQYVTELLKPAYETLHPAGEKVLGTSFSVYQVGGKMSLAVTEQAVQAGYLDWCDYAGFHPYTVTVEEVPVVMEKLRALYGTKPLFITEWNLKQKKDPAKRLDPAERRRRLDAALPLLREKAEVICYYRLLEADREGGWAGLLKVDYSPQEPYHEMFKSWAEGATDDNASAPALRETN